MFWRLRENFKGESELKFLRVILKLRKKKDLEKSD